MLPRASFALALVLACTPDQPTTPPEKWPDLKVGSGLAGDPTTSPPTPNSPSMPATSATPTTAVATPTTPAHAGDPLDALAPGKQRGGLPGPRSGPAGGCEGGQRGVGESWKVDCNECSCGDDGQVTCTAMACGYH